MTGEELPWATPPASPKRKLKFFPSWAEWVALAILAGLIGYFYWWTAMPDLRGKVFSADAESYYNLLTRGFMKGHLYLDMEADPALATLKNPWDPIERAGRGLHDASYYHGRYYIYFGVTPILLLFLPFRLATGLYVSESAADVIFACVGMLASLGLLRLVRDRYFQRASSAWVLASALALGLATMTPVLLRRPSVWEVPITCGYACLMIAFCCLFNALHQKRQLIWLAGASVAMGLAVGARPVYLLACLALLVPLLSRACECGGLRTCWRDREWRRFFSATILPITAVGISLALYNYLRFGNPFQFGQIYQMAGEEVSKLKLFSWNYAFYGFRIYMLAAAGWSPYFPFVTVITPPPGPPGHFGIENAYGVLPNLPFVLVGLGLFTVVGPWRDSRVSRGLEIFSLSVFVAGIFTLLLVMSFGGITNRYMVDFVPAFIQLACFGTLAVSTRPWFCGSVRFFGSVFVVGLLLFSVVFNILVSIQHNELLRAERPDIYKKIAHDGNYVSQFIDGLSSTKYGPVEMKVVFPTGLPGQFESLVATGTSFRADYVYVQYLDDEHIRFGFEHTSMGSSTGNPIHIKLGQEQTVLVEMGSLYPPTAHPFYDSLPKRQAQLFQRTLKVSVDGETALRGVTDFYDATSRSPSVGTSGARPGFKKSFSGKLVSWRRAPESVPAVPMIEYGPLRIELRFPPFSGVRSEPLLCSGETGRGDLIFVRYENEHQVTFGHDNWGRGGRMSAPIEIDPAAVQVVEIDYGALYPGGPDPRWTGPVNRERTLVRLNGKAVIDQPAPFHVCEPDTVLVGVNAIQASSSSPVFTGNVLDAHRIVP